MASGSLAGELSEALRFSLPAATITGTPRAIRARVAWLAAGEVLPEILTLATDTGSAFWATQLIPAITLSNGPPPVQSNTRTGTNLAFLATPYVVPTAVPATCVP